MPGTRRYPPDRIRYANYIWPADWQPETTPTSTPTSLSVSFDHDLQQQHSNCACCIRPSYYYVPPSPEAFQRHRFVLSRCEQQLDPSLLLLDRQHGYSQLISDATSVVLWALWTNLVYDPDLVYLSVDYFCFLIDWLLWRVYVPTEPFPFASHPPPVKTGPPYSDVVQYHFLHVCRRSDEDMNRLNSCLQGRGAWIDMNCCCCCSSSSCRYHTRWKMQQAIRGIFNGQDDYVGYGGNMNLHVCGGPGPGLKLTTTRVHMPLGASCCECLPWPREPVVVIGVEERTTWKNKKKKKKKSKESGCLVM